MRAARTSAVTIRRAIAKSTSASVPNPRSEAVWPPRLPGCPFLELSPDELEDLMSPTLDPEKCGPTRGTPGGGFGICNPDGSRAVPTARSGPRQAESANGSEPKSMIYWFDWS